MLSNHFFKIDNHITLILTGFGAENVDPLKSASAAGAIKRKPGRPKGSKNKRPKTCSSESAENGE